MYRAETIACALASELAKLWDDIILDNRTVVKATPIKRKGVVKDEDYRGIGYLNSSSKRLTIRWTPGHRHLEQATTYKDYQDIQGNNHSNVLANMGDNLSMDFQQPQPHDIVITGQIIPTSAKACIMQVCRQKQTPEVHWVSWLPMKHYRRNAWTPWLWGQVRWWCWVPPGNEHPASAPSVVNNTDHQCSRDWLTVPPGATCGSCGARAGLIGPHTRTNGSKRPTTKNYGSVPDCSYHYPS